MVIDIVKCCTGVSQHECVGGKHQGRNRRGSINGKEGADRGKLMANFFFLDIEETSNVLNHLFVGECQLVASRTVWRQGGDDVSGAANTVGRG